MDEQQLFNDLIAEALAGLDRLDQATKKYGDSAVGQNKRVYESMQPIRAELEQQLRLLQTLNGKTDSGKNAYSSLKNDVPEATRQFTAFQEAIKRNNDLLQGNAQIVSDLKTRYKQLLDEQKGLDTSTDKGARRQRQIATEMSQTTTAINRLIGATEKAKQKVDAVESSYDHLNQTTKALKAELRAMPGAWDSVTNKINVHNRAAVEMQKRIDLNVKALKTMDAQMGDNQRRVGSYGQTMTDFTGQLIGVTSGVGAAIAVFQGIKAALEITAKMERLDAGLRAVSRDNDDFRRSQEFLKQESDQLGLKYESLIKTYKLLKAATKDTSLEGAETEHIFHALTNAGARLQLSNEEVEGSLYAISQMISKGHVSAEELRQQLGERLPGAMRIMAQATGLSTNELDEMMKKGQLLATDVLPKFATELDKIYGGNAAEKINTMTAGWNRMTNAAQDFIAAFNENKKVTTFFGSLLSGIADVTKDMATLVRSDQWSAFFQMFTGNVAASQAIAAGTRAADAMAKKNADEFRALPKDQRDLKVRAQQMGVNAAKQQLDIANSLPKTEENLIKVEALQREFNKQKARSNYLFQLNVKQSMEEVRLSKVKKQEEAEAAKRKEKELDKESKKAAQLAKQQSNEAVGLSRADTEASLAKLDLQRQDGLVSERDFFTKRLSITKDGLDKERSILEKYGQQETDDYKKIQTKKLEAKEQFNRDILKLNLAESKQTTEKAISGVESAKEQGLIDEATFVERRYQITIGGIRDRQRILDEAGRHETQAYQDTENEILDADAKYYKDRLKVAQDNWDKEYQALKDSLATTDELVESNLRQRLAKVEAEYNNATSAVRKLQIQGSITDEEAENRLYDLKKLHIQDISRELANANSEEINAIEAAYNQRINFLQNIADDESNTAQERKEAEKEIGKIRIDLEKRIAKLRGEAVKNVADEEQANSEADTEKEEKDLERKVNKRNQIISAGFQLTQMIGDAVADKDAKRLDQQLRDLEKQKDAELSLYGDNEAAKAAIEKKFDDQRKQIQHQQDIQARDKAIFDILIGGAVSFVSNLKQGPVAAAIAAGLALAQLAIVQSAKLPEYAEGKNVDGLDSYVGPAIAGEKGRELHFTEDGKVNMYNQRTKINVGRNDVILPNRMTEDLLSDLNAFEANRLLHMSQRSAAIVAETLDYQRQEKERSFNAQREFPVERLAEAIKDSFVVEQWNVDNDELQKTIIKGNTRTVNMRNSHQLKGK